MACLASLWLRAQYCYAALLSVAAFSDLLNCGFRRGHVRKALKVHKVGKLTAGTGRLSLVASWISRERISSIGSKRQRRVKGKLLCSVSLYRLDQSRVCARCESNLPVVVITVCFGGKRKQLVDGASGLRHVRFSKAGFGQSTAGVKKCIRAARLQNHRRKLHAQISRAGVYGQLGGRTRKL